MKLIRRILKWISALLLVVVLAGGLFLFIAYWRSTNDCYSTAGAPAHPMKAIRFCEYGPPEVLAVHEIEKPVPNDDEILVRVRAASSNAADSHRLRGGFVTRPFSGMRNATNTRAGTYHRGVVEEVGRNGTDFKAGDEVVGARNGALAEYICARADRAVMSKPENVTFEQAGAVTVAGLTALQGLRDTGELKAGQKVLINGAS